MSEDDLEPLLPELMALVNAERGYPPEGRGAEARLLARLERSAAAMAVVGIGVAATSAPAAAGGAAAQTQIHLKGILLRWLAGKGIVAASALAIGAAGGGALGYRVGKQQPSGVSPAVVAVSPSPPREGSLAAPPSAAPSVWSVSALPLVPPPSASPAAAPNRVDAGESAPRQGDLRGELALLQMGRTALGRHEYGAALDAIDEHAKKYPRGALAEERESLAVQALVGAGRNAEARRRSEQFREKYPQSTLIPVVEAAVRSIP